MLKIENIWNIFIIYFSIIIRMEHAQSMIPTVQPFSFPKEVTKGQSVTAICAILSGTAPFSFQWLKDDEVVTDRPPYIKIQTQNDFSLLSLKSTDRNWTGNYTCTATNVMGSGNFTARLIIYEHPEWFIIPKDTHVVLSHSVKIDCAATGEPNPNITWYKMDGTRAFPIREMNKHKIFRNGTLLLENVRLEDNGTYECVVNNNIGSLQKIISVRVYIPPLFRDDFELIKVRSSHSAVLQCEVAGDGPLSINWTKEYHADTKEARHKIQKTPLPNGILSELFITRVSRQDAGLYICKASNPFGKRERTIKLVVLEPPSSPSDIVIKQIGNDEVTIRWITPYSGNSPIRRYILQYWKDIGAPPKLEEEYVDGDQTSSVLTELKPGTPYVVRLVADNEFGQSTPSIPVKFSTAEKCPTGYPTDLTAIPKSRSSILVRWKPPPPDQRNGLIRGYDLGYRERLISASYNYQEIIVDLDNSDLHQEYMLNNLRANTEYEITIRAFNTAGRGPLSIPVIKRTYDQDALIAPTLWVESTTSSSISLKWTVDMNLQIKDFHYKLYFRPEHGVWIEENLNNPAQNTYVLSGLNENTVYEVFLQTIRGKNQSNPSSVIKANTLDASASMRSVSYASQVTTNPSTTTLIISLSVVTSAVIIVCIVAGACVYVVRIRTRSSIYKTDDIDSRHLSNQLSASESLRISQSNYRYVDVNSRPLLWCSTPAPPVNDYPSPYATLPLRSTGLSKSWRSEGEGLSPPQSEKSESLVNQRIDISDDKTPSCHD